MPSARREGRRRPLCASRRGSAFSPSSQAERDSNGETKADSNHIAVEHDPYSDAHSNADAYGTCSAHDRCSRFALSIARPCARRERRSIGYFLN
jgi:hypothetical protein